MNYEEKYFTISHGICSDSYVKQFSFSFVSFYSTYGPSKMNYLDQLEFYKLEDVHETSCLSCLSSFNNFATQRSFADYLDIAILTSDQPSFSGQGANFTKLQ